MQSRRLSAGLFVSGLALAAVSCGGSKADRPYPVRGKVLFHSKPAAGARVTFVPLDRPNPQSPHPTAAVENDGTFRLTTRLSYDGAPAGRYAVTIIYRSAARKVDDENAGPDLLKGKYGNPKTTPLRAEVKEGTNELQPFLLN